MSSLIPILETAFGALSANKMRSFLTMLGVIVGVSAVIAMVSIGQGASASVKENFARLGTNLLYVSAGSTFRGGVRGGLESAVSLKAEDAEAIVKECPSVAMASPYVTLGAQVVYRNKNWFTSIAGTGKDFPAIRKWPVEEGRFFGKSEIRAVAKVCVLGKTVVANLFEEEDPIGKVIRIRKIPFIVIGVLSERGQSFGGHDQDDTIIIPYTTAQKRLLGIDHIRRILVSAVSEDKTDEAEEEIRALLRKKHNLSPSEEDDFWIRNLSDISQAAGEATKTMTLLLAGIASVSLIVGGIGIMNIMLVSVTERTREIGIRRAVGAKRRDILLQFIVEALTLSITGGIIGILCGTIGSKLISSFAGWPSLISLNSIGLAFLFSAGVGIFFGYYPARKASLLDPIDALRYE